MSEPELDPAAEIWRTFVRWHQKAYELGDAIEKATSPLLAAAASEDSASRLAQCLAHVVAKGDAQGAMVLAALVEQHTEAVAAYRNRYTDPVARTLNSLLEQFYVAAHATAGVARCRLFRALGMTAEEDAQELAEIATFASAHLEGESAKRMRATADKLAADGLLELGRLDEANERFQRATTAFSELEDLYGYATARMGYGALLRRTGRYAEALACQNDAIIVLGEDGGRHQELFAGALVNRATSLSHLGRFAEAARDYSHAAAIFGRVGNTARRAKVHVNLGPLLRAVGAVEQAIESYTNAIPELRSRPAELATCYLNRAVCFRDCNQHDRALADLEEAERIFTTLGRTGDLMRVRINRAEVHRESGQLALAASELTEVDPLPLSADEHVQYRLANALVCWASNTEEGRSQAVRSLELGLTALREAIRHSQAGVTSLEFVRNRYAICRQAVEFGHRGNYPQLVWRGVWSAKGALWDDLLRRRQAASPAAAQLAAGRQDLVKSLLERAVQRAPDPAQDRSLVEQGRRFLDDWNRLTQAGEDLPPDAVEAPERVREKLWGGFAVVDFWVLDEATCLALVLTADEQTITELPMPSASELSEALTEAAGWEQGVVSGVEPGLSAVGRVLMSPLADLLTAKAVTSVYLVPHGVLHHLPLAACVMSSGERFGTRFQLAYLPSATSLTDLRPPVLSGTAVFSAANPNEGTSHTLPFAAYEQQAIIKAWGKKGAVSLRGQQVNSGGITGHLNATLCHFSCHGYGFPEFAPLGHLRLSDDVLTCHDVLQWQSEQGARAVVILNGCTTGVPDHRAVDESIGLMSAFLRTGSSVVLATQRKVDDLAAAEFVIRFATCLQSGESPAQAFAAAQRHLASLTWGDVAQRCRDARRLYPPNQNPREAARIEERLMEALYRAGDVMAARRAARSSMRHYSTARETHERERVSKFTERFLNVAALPPASEEDRPFQHPAFWSAFVLFGRIHGDEGPTPDAGEPARA